MVPQHLSSSLLEEGGMRKTLYCVSFKFVLSAIFVQRPTTSFVMLPSLELLLPSRNISNKMYQAGRIIHVHPYLVSHLLALMRHATPACSGG